MGCGARLHRVGQERRGDLRVRARFHAAVERRRAEQVRRKRAPDLAREQRVLDVRL